MFTFAIMDEDETDMRKIRTGAFWQDDGECMAEGREQARDLVQKLGRPLLVVVSEDGAEVASSWVDFK